MLKKYLSDLAFIQVLNLLVKPVWILIIDRTVQNQLSQEAYGNYFALFNFSLLFFIILDLGIASFNATSISKEPKKLKQLFGNLVGLKIMLAILYIFLVLLFGSFMGYEGLEFRLLSLLCVVQILTSFNQYFRSSISAFQLFKWDGVFMVMDRLLLIGLCALLIWGSWFELSSQNFIYAQILGLGMVSILLISYIYFKLERVRLNFSLKKIFPLLRQAWPYGLLIALMGLYNYLDGVMLKALASDREVQAGIYAMGYRLFFAIFMFAQVFSNVLLSLYSRNINDKQSLYKLSTFNGKFLFLSGVSMAFFSWVYRMEIIQYLYPVKFSEDAALTFGLLMFSFLGSALILVYGTLMTAKEQLKKLNLAAALTLLLNLVLNFILIPKEGAVGAAKATLLSQVLFGLACLLITRRSLRFRYPSGEFVRILSSLTVLGLGILLSSQYVTSVYVHLATVIITTGLAFWLANLFHSRSLNTIQ
jgi:O-antigen/teichoic acid export membrane protein